MYYAARGVRTSSLRNISLRHNRINATGAVALALMIRDYPDVVPGTNTPPSVPSSPTPSSVSLMASPPSTPTTDTQKNIPPTLLPPPPGRSGPAPPPPRHPASVAPQTTYTPYIPRSRRGAAVSPSPNPLSPNGQPIPIITSSAQGGITTRHPVSHASHGQDPSANQPRHVQGPSAALLDKVRALDALPRLGALRTLDLKGNDLRVSSPLAPFK
jgi:protein phosphatase 1 regulatory subunit 37